MVLTDETKERMRVNRERALEIRRKKMEEAAALAAKKELNSSGESNSSEIQKEKNDAAKMAESKEELEKILRQKEEDENVELEDFEVGASPYVTKREALQMYCLPQGTLDVCPYIEKDNPRNKSWNTMKLFYRSDIRRRARERHGGIEGLVNERNKRKRKQFERDLEKNKDIFKRSRT